MKITVIQEHVGWENKSVAQLMGNLHIYEMEIFSYHNKKEKNITFVDEEHDSKSNPDES